MPKRPKQISQTGFDIVVGTDGHRASSRIAEMAAKGRLRDAHRKLACLLVVLVPGLIYSANIFGAYTIELVPRTVDVQLPSDPRLGVYLERQVHANPSN